MNDPFETGFTTGQRNISDSPGKKPDGRFPL